MRLFGCSAALLFFLLVTVTAYSVSVSDTSVIVQLITSAEKSDSVIKVTHALRALQLADSILKALPNSDKTNRMAVAALKEKTCRLLAFYYRNEGNFDKELYYFQQCLQLRQQTNDKRNIASAYVNIGISYYRMGYIPRALNNFSKGITMLEEVKDTGYVATMYNNLGTIFTKQGETKEALIYFNRGLNNFRKVGNYAGIAYSLNNIGSVYYKLGQTDTAYTLFNKAWGYAVKSESQADQITTYTNLGIINRDRGNLKLAEQNFSKALELNKTSHNKPGIAAGYNQLATIYLLQKKYKNALKYAQASLQLYSEQRNIEGLRNVEQTFTRIDSTTGNYKSALAHYYRYIAYSDSLLNEETQKATIKNHIKYEFDKKEAESKVLQQKKDAQIAEEMQRQKFIRNSFIAGFGIMLLFAGVFFFQRNSIQKERTRSDNLLLNILPAEVAEELKLKGNASAKQFDNVTVLFTDFKSFTTVSEHLTPQQLVDELHECFTGFDRICEKYNIEKIKTVGDAYLAVAGLPVANELHAHNTVKAALEIRDFMLQRKQNLGEKSFEIRIGIHSGSVVAGIVGIKKFAYDIWGDTVNTAARMEQNGEAGKVNISEATYTLLNHGMTKQGNSKASHAMTFTYRGEIEAKNKGKLKMYFVS